MQFHLWPKMASSNGIAVSAPNLYGMVETDRNEGNVVRSVDEESAKTEFWNWLESCLDGWGLDTALYARCVLSILRQPTNGSVSEELMETDEEIEIHPSTPSGGIVLALPVYNRKDSNTYSSSDTSAASMDGIEERPIGVDSKSSCMKRSALIECLRTVELDRQHLESFVAEILSRYDNVTRPHGKDLDVEKPNESIDSGVCPSPEESFQNYDEAFPPLSQRSSGTPQTVVVGDSNLGGELNFLATEPDELSPVEKHDPPPFFVPSLPLDNNRRSRLLRSCPDMEQWGDGIAAVASSAANQKHAATPHFIVPKLNTAKSGASFKVGSCPTKLEFGYSGPPSNSDISGWLCAQYFYPAEKCCPPNLGVNVNGSNNKGSNHQLNRGSLGSSGEGTIHSGGMTFDAPRFILHIINEDEHQDQPTTGTSQATTVYPKQTNPYPMPKFAWDSLVPGGAQADYNLFQGSTGPFSEIFSMNGSSSMTGGGNGECASPLEFCVPRMGGVEANCGAEAKKTGKGESPAVPVSDKTHFVPIKSESMEEAFVPTPRRADETNAYAMDSYENEEYYVLRDHTGPIRPVPVVLKPPVQYQQDKDESDDEIEERERRSLPLKFKAARPEKECQTEIGNPWEQRWAESNQCLLPFLAEMAPTAGEPGNRTVCIAAGSSIWEQIPAGATASEWPPGDGDVVDIVVDVASRKSSFGGNRIKEGAEDDDDGKEAVCDRSADEDDLLLNYVANISIISPLLETVAK